jgi:cytochrome P450
LALEVTSYLYSLAVKSNLATELPPEQRISDEDILHNINSLIFAGSDTTSLSLAWGLLQLAEHPMVQRRLREELLSVGAAQLPTGEEMESVYGAISDLPYLNNVTREVLRLIPPIHSSLRVATRDDVLPTSFPVRMRDGRVLQGGEDLKVSKGTLVHVPIEGLNLDREMWGDDGWEFK